MRPIIVVGVDGSETASKASFEAKDLAVALKATLHIVTAFQPDKAETLNPDSEKWMVSDASRATAVARKATAELDDGTLPIESFAVQGTPAAALFKHAEGSDAEVIVVGNRRMQGPKRVLGSVANTVAHNAPCDVYIVKTEV